MWILTDPRGALLAWAPTVEGLPPAPTESVLLERPAWAAPPAEPYRYDPAVRDWVVPVPARAKLSRLAFRWRFTLEEQLALRAAEREHPEPSVRDTLAIMRESLSDVEDDSGVDVADPRTVGGATLSVDLLVAAGLLSPEARDARLAAVLAP